MSHVTSQWLSTTPHCGIASTTVIVQVPVSVCLCEVTPWKSDEQLLQVPQPTSRVRYVEKLSYLSLNEAVNPYCNCNNSRKSWVKGLQWNSGIYVAYTWDTTLYPGLCTRKGFFMENPRLIQPLQTWPCEGDNWSMRQWCNCRILITALNPSHSTPDKAHTVWVAVRYQVA